MTTVRRRWTVDDLRDLPSDGNRYEVIDGELFVTPSSSWTHRRAVLELARLLEDYFTTQLIANVLIAPADVTFSRTRVLEPDLFVVPLVNGRRPNQFEDVGRLLLAAEVLSPSTARADRVHKPVLYREERVPDYWIIDLDARAIERSTPADSRVDIIDEQLECLPEGASVPFALDVPMYFVRVLDG